MDDPVDKLSQHLYTNIGIDRDVGMFSVFLVTSFLTLFSSLPLSPSSFLVCVCIRIGNERKKIKN